jgi:putative SOS response-associated peptidase YedK
VPGRFAVTSSPDQLRAFFGYREEPEFPPRYNIAPTQPIAVVTATPHTQGGQRRFILMRWGFLPAFVKDPQAFSLIVHARAETLTIRPSFKAAVKRRRCLIPADGFYEWLRGASPQATRAFLIRRADGAPMGFAGLYETWSDASGSEIDTACIVTTAANRTVAPMNERMPAIVDPADFHFWLDNDGVEPAEALSRVRPAPEDWLERIEIATDVNRVGNDDPGIQRALVGPAGLLGKTQGDLF